VAVRLATPDDAETVGNLVGEFAAHQSQSDDVTGDVTTWRALLARPEVTILLAEVDEQPVGYVSAVRRLHLWTADDLVVLDDLYVRDGHRDRGIGLLLMHELSKRADNLTITWGVQPENHAAIRFYERLGATARTKVMCAWPPARRTRK
jgi:ribosomal protein S18 acetylase RimI-like enzyme